MSGTVSPANGVVGAGRLFVIFMGPSLGGLAPLGLALDQPALAAQFGGGGQAMLQAGTIFTAPSLAIIVGAPLGGYLAERFGYRLTLLISSSGCWSDRSAFRARSSASAGRWR